MIIKNILKELLIINVINSILGIVIGASFVMLVGDSINSFGKILVAIILLIGVGAYYFLITIFEKRTTLIVKDYSSRKLDTAEEETKK